MLLQWFGLAVASHFVSALKTPSTDHYNTLGARQSPSIQTNGLQNNVLSIFDCVCSTYDISCKVTWDQYSFYINGERLMLFSGEIHPYRSDMIRLRFLAIVLIMMSRLPVASLYLDVFQKVK